MTKRSINLIITKKEKESEIVKRLNIILPIISGVFLFLFLIMFIISVIYSNNNLASYNKLKKDVELHENKISSQKGAEGLYTLVYSRMNILDKVSANISNFASLMSEVASIDQDKISITSATADQKGDVTVGIIASSSAELESLVATLLKKEQKKLFSNIQARGIIRQKKGSYQLSIILTADPILLKP